MNKSKTSLFLMELILSVLIFSIAAAVCVRVFMKSYSISNGTRELNMAVTRCTSAAELFYGFSGDLSQIKRELDTNNTSMSEKGKLTLFYDNKYEKCSEREAMYYMQLINHREEDILTCDIIMYRYADDEEIYALTLDLYTGGAAGAGSDMPQVIEPESMGGVL